MDVALIGEGVTSMKTVQCRQKVRINLGAALGLVMAFGMVGCVTLPTLDTSFLSKHETPCQVVTTWQPEVLFSADPARGGMSAPGIGGRLYLFGNEIGKPLKGNGSLVVDLYDVTGSQSPEPVHLEQWQIDAKTLNRLGKNDPIGFGYTIYLPWSTCLESYHRIQLKVKYQTTNGFALYTDSGPITMTHPESAVAKILGVNTEKSQPITTVGGKTGVSAPQIRSGLPVVAIPFPKQPQGNSSLKPMGEIQPVGLVPTGQPALPKAGNPTPSQGQIQQTGIGRPSQGNPTNTQGQIQQTGFFGPSKVNQVPLTR